jgi:hypothetical protein
MPSLVLLNYTKSHSSALFVLPAFSSSCGSNVAAMSTGRSCMNTNNSPPCLARSYETLRKYSSKWDFVLFNGSNELNKGKEKQKKAATRINTTNKPQRGF